ncbi:alpha/beta hydrolase [Kitasatospora sp. NBC_01287]|uniref:alpha/beta fold hydrolase n=1 Tax=Kitasatospora sp. NBC_01287 TaxID=2903573 RepID=UPI00224DFD44|nr:alpha/beta hydrolase [Kitasatospora sp. NBC_01287]MCX4746260.1 alpha/beta hydrolase [Kitasatospora sp. NBC_01287]
MSASHRTPRALTLPRLAVAVAVVTLGAVACSPGGGHATSASSSASSSASTSEPSTRATATAATTASSTIVPNSALSGPGAFLGPVRQIPVDGIRIGYRQFGSGPDLIMVMGDTGTMSDWTVDLLGRLGRHYHVTIFDNRGVGYTTDDTSVPDSIPLMADDTVGLVKALGLRHPTLLGWSMGGEIGLTVAALHPGAISALVSTGGDLGGSQAINTPSAVAEELNSPKTTGPQMLDLLFPADATAARTAYVEQLGLIPPEKVGDETLLRQYQAGQAYESFEGTWDKLPDSTIPMLITNGSLDEITPPGNASIITQRAEHAELVMFPDAGHAMLVQDSGRFVSLVTRFTEASGVE